jgi:membrane-associated phospholipid phosphatase
VTREPPILAGRWRYVAAGTAVLAAAALAGLSALYAGQSEAGQVDQSIDGHLRDFGTAHLGLSRFVASLGGPVPIFLITVALVVGLLVTRRPRRAMLAVATPVVASAISEWLLKPAVDRHFTGALSFPSGHATGIFSFVFVCIVLLGAERGGIIQRWRGWLIVALLVIGAAVACALAAIQAHYFTDTVGGALVALVVTVILALVIDALSRAFAARAVGDRAVGR